jgi:PTH1 family peptidyl-tRNA hydrolase
MLIAALGNPGPEYFFTRHNIAWQMIEYLSFFPDLKWNSKFNGLYAIFKSEQTGNKNHYLLKPLTFMNLSGQSVQALMQFFKIDLEELLVIHDEIELDFGILGYKKGGGLAGHNGLRSVTSCLGTRNFNRLRLGISRPSHDDITSYVLGEFSKTEQKELPFFLEESARILEKNLQEATEDLVKKYKKHNILV